MLSTCRQLTQATIAVCVLSTCGSHVMLQGSAAEMTPAKLDGHGKRLALPPVGEARSAALGNGWPVWVVRHRDGTASVVSAVAPPHTGSAATLFTGPAALIRWLPAQRRFVAGDIAYDELGQLLGYAVDDSCFEGCPRITEPAFDERDLDTFAITIAADRIVVGAFRPSPPRPFVPRWVDWDHLEHVDRDLSLDGEAVRPLAPVPIPEAMQRPIGSYSIVIGSIVQSTTDTPRVCGDTPRCGVCYGSSPDALGIGAIAVNNNEASHVESGTMLVRRDRRGLAVVAMSRFGGCTNETLRVTARPR